MQLLEDDTPLVPKQENKAELAAQEVSVVKHPPGRVQTVSTVRTAAAPVSTDVDESPEGRYFKRLGLDTPTVVSVPAGPKSLKELSSLLDKANDKTPLLAGNASTKYGPGDEPPPYAKPAKANDGSAQAKPSAQEEEEEEEEEEKGCCNCVLL